MAFGYNIFFIMVAVVLPIVCLIIVSLHPVWTGKIVLADITTINYVKTLFWWRPGSDFGCHQRHREQSDPRLSVVPRSPWFWRW